jgi:hypothetical protein
MSSGLFFWKQFHRPYRLWYKIMLSIGLAALLVYLISWIFGTHWVIDWDLQTLVKPVQVLVDRVNIGLYDIPVRAENYVILQNFVAGPIQIPVWSAYVFWAFFWFALICILGILPSLSRFWFYTGILAFTGILVTLRLENLLLFGDHSKAAMIISLIGYFLPSYYFHAFGKHVHYLWRVLTFALITAALLSFFSWQASVEKPVYHLISYSIYTPLILSVVFIFMTAHEIMAGFLYLVSSGNTLKSKNSLMHFLLIALIYLINIVLVYLYNRKMIDWNPGIVSAFWILPLSAILGIWGFRHRESVYSSMFAFLPTGAILYMSLATICLSTTAYGFTTSNDALLSVIQDAVIYSQIGYGIIFIVYVLANFFPLLMQNVRVYKVVYQPKYMPFFTSRFASLIFVLALVLLSDKKAYYHSFATYYNSVADLFLVVKDPVMAEEYYKLADIYDPKGHRPNYALSSMARSIGNNTAELNFLSMAVEKRPTAQAYANIGRAFSDRDNFFDALFALRIGVEKFPEEGRLLNNLGNQYAESNLTDSAYYYLTQAQNFRKSRDAASANIYGLLSVKDLSIRRDTLADLLKETEYIAARNNLMVLASGLGIPAGEMGNLKFEAQPDQLVYIYNQLLNRPELADSVFWHNFIQFYQERGSQWFRDNIEFASSLASILNGNLAQGYLQLEQKFVQEPENRAYLGNLIGWLLLKNKAPLLSARYFRQSLAQGAVQAWPGLGLALAEAGMGDSARAVWQKVLQLPDTSVHSMAMEMLQVFEKKDIKALSVLTEREKYNYLRYHWKEFEQEALNAIFIGFVNEEIKLRLIIDIAETLLSEGRISEARPLIAIAGESDYLHGMLLNRFLALGIQQYIIEEDTENLGRLIRSLEGDRRGIEAWYELAEVYLKSKQTSPGSRIPAFEHIGYKNPFFEQAVLSSVAHLQMHDKDKAYDVLSQAVRINEFSLRLQQSFIWMSAELGLRAYASEALEKLSTFADASFVENTRARMEEIILQREDDW